MKKNISKYLQAVEKIAHFLRVDIWRMPLKELSPARNFLLTQLRVLILALRGVSEDKILLRAPALTFYSLFSIVPIAALAFAIATGFGLEMYLERQLHTALTGREEVFHWLMELTEAFLEGIHGGTVAAFGLIILLFTITMLLTNIEKSFNEIWQVGKGRPLSRKFSDYFAMMFVVPIFFIVASVTTVYLNTQLEAVSSTILNPLLLFSVRLIPYILIWSLFTILYMVMPNTNVQFSSALVAGIIAGTIFQLVQWAYVAFQVGAARFGAMYGSFAALPLLMIWMQVSWIVVLFGAELSYANHNVASYEFEAETKNISPFNKKILTLYILHLLIANFKKGEKPITPEQVSTALQIPNSLVRNVLNDLTAVNLVSETNTGYSKKSAYQPAIDINLISIKMVLELLDHRGMDVLIAKPSSTLDALKNSLHDFYALIDRTDKNKLLKDL